MYGSNSSAGACVGTMDQACRTLLLLCGVSLTWLSFGDPTPAIMAPKGKVSLIRKCLKNMPNYNITRNMFKPKSCDKTVENKQEHVLSLDNVS